jgi:hypothetical protein
MTVWLQIIHLWWSFQFKNCTAEVALVETVKRLKYEKQTNVKFWNVEVGLLVS